MYKVIIEIVNWVFECMELIESKAFDDLQEATEYANRMLAENEEFEATFIVDGHEFCYDGSPDALVRIRRLIQC